jgi:hypothetical protein
MLWFLGLVFMGTCNRLAVLNQDEIRNQPGGGGGEMEEEGVVDSIKIATVSFHL